MKLADPRIRKAAVHVSGYLTAGIVLLSLTHASLRAGAKNLKPQTETLRGGEKKSGRQEEKSKPSPVQRNWPESRSLTEWRAFEVYHPSSAVSEDALFHTFRGRQDPASSGSKEAIEEKQSKLILGAKSLLPILRSVFGDQIRGLAAAEREPYFLTHPTALFKPEQLKALCAGEETGSAEESGDSCWKPQLTDDYLGALTDFAGDACPYLVTQEAKNLAKNRNKLIKSADFNTHNLKVFATHSLRIPNELITEQWLADIVDESKRAIRAENQEPDATPAETFRSEDLYSMTCQAMILSEEFYTR